MDVSALAPTAAELLALDDLVPRLRAGDFPILGSVGEIASNSLDWRIDPQRPRLLAPCDLQPVKASGVTYVSSMLERLVEERSGGDPRGLSHARRQLDEVIGGSLHAIRPGSAEAAALKQALIEDDQWSHYLEVAIGPDAESFTKCPPMAAVGFGAAVGLRSDSRWNNPEPELVLAVAPSGRIVGVTLGNDVNLRDFEGRSPLLLDKAKDNNASAAIGPFIRLFDEHYSLADAKTTRVEFAIEGDDGYRLAGEGSVGDIARELQDLVQQIMGRHHQYPDGLVLFTGTMWVPIDDRLGQGNGFSHRHNDRVSIRAERIGWLVNTTRACEECPPWTFGLSQLMRNLSARRLIG